MAGLLGDSWDDPRSLAVMQAAAGLLGPGSNAQRFAGAGATYAQQMQAERARKLIEDERRQMMEARAQEMEARRRQQAEAAAALAKRAEFENALRGVIRSPDQQAMTQFGGPTRAAAAAAPGMSPQLDQNALLGVMRQFEPASAIEMLKPKPDDVMNVAPGGTVWSKRDQKALFTAPDRADKPPSAVQEYQFAKTQGYPGTFEQWSLSQGRARATNIGLPKIDIKVGEGVAGQVGPMLKGSQEQAMAGVKLVDSAQRILTATQGGNVFLGPMAEIRLKTAQFADLLGVGGKDNAEKILNTRAVVRGMAEQAVAARSQLGGQAQISNSEQELLNKATSGRIGELTGPETIQIAKLNDRLGRALYAKHQSMLKGLQAVPDTQNLMPFFQVPPLPEMPTISAPTGMPDVSAIEAELRRRQQSGATGGF